MANVLGELFGNIAGAIREKTGETGSMKPAQFPDKIRGIETGGAAADVRYVTFMSEDGTVEYGIKAVAVGDDCADPIARGVFDTPTKESTAQYNYTHFSWGLSPNGATDPDALKNVTKSRTVYATFVSAVRYYTVTYYDGDTVLKTESLPYGAMPSYVPTKIGCTFNGWTTEIVAVTSDAVYYSQWIAKMDFASLTWAQIAKYAENGEAATVFEIGATKKIVVRNVTVAVEIIGFNHDDLADGSGKAGITLKMNTSFGNQGPGGQAPWGGGANNATYNNMSWDDCDTRKYWNSTTLSTMLLTGNLPSDLVAVIKQVSKKYYDIPDKAIETTNDYIWLPSLSELGFTNYGDHGECYEAYTQNKVAGTSYAELVEYVDDKAVLYATRSKASYGLNLPCIAETGTYTTYTQGSSKVHTFPHFCI